MRYDYNTTLLIKLFKNCKINNMNSNFDLQKHIENGVEKIVADTLKATLKDPRESAFMARFAAASRKASKRRLELEEEGLHVPGFLIASITSSCNLHCAGCYSRCTGATEDTEPTEQLSADDWLRVFREAEDLGVSFIMLAGGEPMLRRSIIELAGTIQSIIFPVFTNGTYMDEAYFGLFDRCRNLIPVFSIEGGRIATDVRRGAGVYDRLMQNIDRFAEKHLLFGASITVTTDNIREVTSPGFLNTLMDRGSKLVIYIEYVPVDENSQHLAPGNEERAYMEQAMESLRSSYDAVMLSFPGDELAMGGCMAAGREFFHINSHGGAEPCPFSPYSDTNIKDTSLRDALRSDLFVRLREEGLISGEHKGGCVLYEKRSQVQALLSR